METNEIIQKMEQLEVDMRYIISNFQIANSYQVQIFKKMVDTKNDVVSFRKKLEAELTLETNQSTQS